MVPSPHNSAHYWIDLIANIELPAITSTAKMLDKFNNDDKSSLPKLSKAILHDQALASCLLKVANNAQHASINKITTVSRASVVLGIQAVKNICLTSRLVEGLVTTKALDKRIHHQLTQSMATAFHSGLLAKMMAPQYSEDTQEELYLAAMLYRIGETAFWSTGHTATLSLLPYVHEPHDIFVHQCHKEIGTSFSLLSRELAKIWGLSDLLLKALDEPQTRTIEMQIIYFADQLSNIIASPSCSQEEYQKLLVDICQVTGLTQKKLIFKIEKVQKSAKNLLESYGAPSLIEYIKPLPRAVDFQSINSPVLRANPNKERDLLNIYTQLNTLTKSNHDFTDFLASTVQGIAKIFSFEETSFFMLQEGKSTIKNRFTYDVSGQKIDRKRQFNLALTDNIISHVMSKNKPVLINNYQEKRWYHYITGELADFINNGVIFIIPIKIGATNIGVITAQVFVQNKEISEEDFTLCCGLIDHMNLCLTILSSKH